MNKNVRILKEDTIGFFLALFVLYFISVMVIFLKVFLNKIESHLRLCNLYF